MLTLTPGLRVQQERSKARLAPTAVSNRELEAVPDAISACSTGLLLVPTSFSSSSQSPHHHRSPTRSQTQRNCRAGIAPTAVSN
eukprot:1160548-Pelagomonas_calceolata.AAC.4